MNIFAEYIKYRLKAKGRHGIHSPFVYDFVDKCLRIPLTDELISKRKSIYQAYRHNHQAIQVKDFGAGSKKLGRTRKINSIFKNSSSKGVYADLLFRISAHYPISTILELGTSLGVGTLHMHLGNKKAKITTLEACPETRRIALENSLKEIPQVTSELTTFDDYLSTHTPKAFDFIFVDGHHDGTALLNYLSVLEAWSHDETIFILDDIRWSEDMFDAWNQIVKNGNYHLTMDLFRMGIVMKRTHQEKEHFIIKI